MSSNAALERARVTGETLAFEELEVTGASR